MRCPGCGARDGHVLKTCDCRDSPQFYGSIRRRRECRLCGYRWTTFEITPEALGMADVEYELGQRARRALEALRVAMGWGASEEAG